MAMNYEFVILIPTLNLSHVSRRHYAACECAAKFYLEFGDRESSLNHFRLAHQKYTDWGAIAKAELLFAFANEQFDYFLN